MADDETPVDISRLKRRRDFLRVAAEQRKWVTPGLILQAAPMPRASLDRSSSALAAEDPTDQSASVRVPAPPLARVGFTVSKKVGNSVKRNRARRRLRAVADALMTRLATPGTDYVVIGRTQTLDRPFDALLRDLETALKRVLSAPKGPPSGKRSPRRGGRRQGQSPGDGANRATSNKRDLVP